MAIALRGTKLQTAAGTTSNQNFSLGTAGFNTEAGTSVACEVGDFVILGVVSGSTADRTFATSSTGWSNLTELYSNGSTTDTNLAVWYKFLDADDLTNGFDLTGGSGSTADAFVRSAVALTGVDPTTPIDVAAVSALGTGTTNLNPASITPATSGAWVVVVGGGGSTTTTAYTNPGGYSSTTNNFRSDVRADTNDVAALLAIHTKGWTSGAVDPAQVTGGAANAGDSWAAYTIAVRPALVATAIPRSYGFVF